MPILSNALKCYSRARDYCMSAKQVVNMCVNVIKVSACNDHDNYARITTINYYFVYCASKGIFCAQDVG